MLFPERGKSKAVELLKIAPAPLKFPDRTMAPELALIVTPLLRIIPRAMVCASVELFWIVLLLLESVIRLPERVKAPAPLLNVMLPKVVSAAMSLVDDRRVVPAKVRLLLATGAVPPQFAPVLQLLSEPAPFHVAV